MCASNMPNKQKLRVGHKDMSKRYDFDFEVKVVSGHMNVRDTLYHSDTFMCQIWYASVKAKNKLGDRTRICTED